ncbi:MAG: hypothetical protein JRD88_08605 [Deltaproteobacteria bacterium]|nr:hypothetical protein [Deltaproteobacteria bacterium]
MKQKTPVLAEQKMERTCPGQPEARLWVDIDRNFLNPARLLAASDG